MPYRVINICYSITCYTNHINSTRFQSIASVALRVFPDAEEHDPPPLPLPEEHDPPPPPPPPPNHHDQENCCIAYQRHTWPQINIPHLCELIIIPKLKETMDFVSALSTATLTDPVTKFGMQAQEHLHNPPRQPLQIDNTGHHHSISIYLTTEHSSEDAYEKICQSTAWNFSGAPGIEDLLSFY